MKQSLTNPVGSSRGTSILRPVLLAGLLVGTLDIAAAVIHTLVKGGEPEKMLRYIASGVFGNQAFSGGSSFPLLGLLFHYCIAFGWTYLFFAFYPRLNLLSKNRILTGVVYGLFVWFVMNRVVLPLSNTPPAKFQLTQALIAALTLIVAIGLPLSFIAHRHFGRSGRL